MPSTTKRRRTGRMPHKTPKASKAKSCEACRRLKTRCEINDDAGRCHRCEVLEYVSWEMVNVATRFLTALSIKCSLGGTVRNHHSQAPFDEETISDHKRACHERFIFIAITFVKLFIQKLTAKDFLLWKLLSLRFRLHYRLRPSRLLSTMIDQR